LRRAGHRDTKKNWNAQKIKGRGASKKPFGVRAHEKKRGEIASIPSKNSSRGRTKYKNKKKELPLRGGSTKKERKKISQFCWAREGEVCARRHC